MHEIIGSLISNESLFGRIMTRIGTVIAANILFILFSMPVVTAGASLAALYHTMLKMLRSKDAINPFKQFWKGFKSNFKQATIAWLIALALILFGYFDVRICQQAGGFIGSLRYGVYALGILLFIILIHLFPTMAAFSDTLPGLMRSGLYFALRKPFKLLVNLFFHFFPMFLTYSDRGYQPLYTFLWVTFGFGAIALLTSYLLLSEFEPYLPVVDECGDFILKRDGTPLMPGEDLEEDDEAELMAEAFGDGGMTEEEVLEEMRKLRMIGAELPDLGMCTIDSVCG